MCQGPWSPVGGSAVAAIASRQGQQTHAAVHANHINIEMLGIIAVGP